MALIFMDGFDHITTDQLPVKNNGIEQCTVGATYARFGGRGVRFTSDNYYWSTNIGVSKSTIYFGAAFKKNEGGTLSYNASTPWMRFRDVSAVTQIRLHAMPDFSIAAYQGDGTLLGASAESTLPNQKWFYFEAKITISATVGEVTLRINENQILNLTSQDTKNGDDYVRSMIFYGMFSSREVYMDDMYIDDAQFHGDCRVRTFVPDSISSTNNNFTASAGNKDECVDDIPSNEDTDYITSDTLNHKQTFGITTGVLGTVIGIQLNNHCRVDEAGVRKITPIIRSNSINYLGTETEEIPANFYFENEIWETDPDDSNVWTQTKLEAAEFGLEITT